MEFTVCGSSLIHGCSSSPQPGGVSTPPGLLARFEGRFVLNVLLKEGGRVEKAKWKKQHDGGQERSAAEGQTLVFYGASLLSHTDGSGEPLMSGQLQLRMGRSLLSI